MADLANFRLWHRDMDSVTAATTAAYQLKTGHGNGYWLTKETNILKTGDGSSNQKLHEILEGFTSTPQFVYDWGMGKDITRQAQHREPNQDIAELGVKWSMCKLPPKVLRCGHRCAYQSALIAIVQNIAYRHAVTELHGRKETPQYYGGEDDIYTTESVYREQLENQARRGVYGAKWHPDTCCRCALAQHWFGLESSNPSAYYSQHDFACSYVAGCYDGKFGTYFYKRIEDGKLGPNGGAHGPLPAYAHNLKSKHLGWHAGLIRPNILYKNPDSEYRRNMYREVRFIDDLGPLNGVPTPRNYLCGSCYQVAKGLPPELFWIARGMKPATAKRMLNWELDTFQKPRFPKSRKRQWMASMTFQPVAEMHAYTQSRKNG